MSTIADMLADYAPLSHLSSGSLEAIARHAEIVQFDVDARMLRTGDPADTMYLLRHGTVAIEVLNSAGGSITIETLGAGEVVGISWMLPPYRLSFDARCVDQCAAIAVDAAALRLECDNDPEVGYELYKLLAGVVRERLQATRLQLLDLYRTTL